MFWNKLKLPKQIRLVLICLLLAAIAGIWAVYAVGQGSSPPLTRAGFTLHYIVDLTAPSQNTARITLVIETHNITRLNLSLGFYHSIPEGVQWLPEDLSFNAEPRQGFSVREEQRAFRGVVVPSWHLYFRPGTRIQVAYTRSFSARWDQTRLHGLFGYFGPELFMATGERFLIMPETIVETKVLPPDYDYSGRLHAIRMEFLLPESWGVWTPWNPLDEREFDVWTYKDANINLTSLALSTIAAGPSDRFITRTRTLGSTEVTFVLDKQIRDLERKADDLFLLFDRVQALWGESIDTRYLAVFVAGPRLIWAGEWTNSGGFSENQGNPGLVGEMFIHTIFHRWNAWLPFGTRRSLDDSAKWYSEGWNEYYCDKLLNQMGVFPRDWHFLRSWYAEYKRSYRGTPLDAPVGRPSTSTFIVYRKGALVAYMLDKEIQARTGGARSLDDVIKAIWKQYGHGQGMLDNWAILRILKAVSGQDFFSFFNDYVFGTKPLVIPEFEG